MKLSRTAYLLAAVGFFAVTSIIAFNQPARSDESRANGGLLGWLFYPVERNLPKWIVEADLNAVYALGENRVWAVGNKGLILYSEDGGRTWIKQPGGEASPTPSPTATLTPSPANANVSQNANAARARPSNNAVSAIRNAVTRSHAENLKDAEANREKAHVSRAASQNDNSSTSTTSTGNPRRGRRRSSNSTSKASDNLAANLSNNTRTPTTPAANRPRQTASRRPTTPVRNANVALGPTPTSTPSAAQTAPTPVTPQEDLIAVRFADSQRGWALSREGQSFNTTDGGVHWSLGTRWNSGDDRLRNAVFSPDGLVISYVIPDRWLAQLETNVPPFVHTLTNVRSIPLDPPLDLNAVYFLPDGTQAWVVGARGQVINIDRRGDRSNWVPQSSGTNLDIYGLFFSNPRQGWIVGDQGLIRHTNDGGQSWQEQTSGTKTKLFGVYFLPDEKRGWVVGWEGTILKTEDGGARWTALTQGAIENLAYEFSPPRWYYLSWIFPALFLFFAVRRREAEELEPEQSIADELVSDRPLEAGDPDPLQFRNIVLGLSRFLRNENTLPPLTIAVTGEWGTGKSSLMNLLRANLRSFGFRPVWFNAWHHQKEEHLLASLLQNVRLQAIPRWWSYAGLSFRTRLLIIRGWRNWLPVLILLFFSALSVGYFVSTYKAGNLSIDKLNTSASALFKYNFSDLAQPGVLLNKASKLTLILSIIGLLVTVWKGMTAFGVNPASLLASVSRGLRMRDLDAQTSFRQKFAVEFRDVTMALDVRSMIIFIDDLDRCRPENILEALEAVNFLVSSGDCFVVLGMARERVERYVGLSFKDVAEELIEDLPTENSQPLVNKEKRRKRAQYARQYLDKLINIEVPVPVPSAAQSRELLVGDRTRYRILKKPGWGQAQTIFMKVWPILIAASVLYAGYRVGQQIFSKGGAAPVATSSEQTTAISTSSSPVATMMPTASSARQTSSTNNAVRQGPTNANSPGNTNNMVANTASLSNSNSATAGSSATDTNANADSTADLAPTPTPIEVEIEQRKPKQRAAITAPSSVRDIWAYGSFIPLSLLILIAAYWLLTRRPDLVIKDSEAFEKALAIWHPLIFSKQTTPRSLKRFMNRVRYLAMRQREQEDRPPLWKRLFARLDQRLDREEPKDAAPSSRSFIPESLLVALAAIQQFDPRLIEDAAEFKRMIEGTQFRGSGYIGASLIIEAIETHMREFGNWDTIGSHRKSFLTVSADIRVN